MELKYIERPFEVKAIDDEGVFSGYGSVFGNVDSYKEIVAPGAFSDSLAEWKASGRLPPVLWQHRSGEPVGPHLEMFEDAHGLFTKGHLLVNDVVRAKEARALMKAKAVNGLSIGFVPREDTFDKITGIRTLTKIDLWEVSIVTFPANPAAQIANVKSAIDALEDLDAVERYLCQAGCFSRAQSKALVHRIKATTAQRQAEGEEADLRAALESLQKALA